MIQVCAKLGGSPWGLKGLPLLDRPTMVIGIDVTHMVGRNKVSLVGMTATIDRYMSKYFVSSATKLNPKKKKLIDITFELEPLF
jgi:aubergine-like protein